MVNWIGCGGFYNLIADSQKGNGKYNKTGEDKNFYPQVQSALLVRNNTLYVFWTQVGHAPERILVSTIKMKGDWSTWQESDPTEILRPERNWEGADLEITPSRRGYINVRANQLRDPAIYEEDEDIYLLYSVAGESGIAISKLIFR